MTENTIQEELAKQIFIRRNIELLLIAVLLFVFGVANKWVNPIFEFDRLAVENGQWWRILTCNMVHLSVTHMLLNLCGFVLATLIFKEHIQASLWYVNILTCSFAVGLGLLLFDQNVRQYVGLSGALYGILAFGAVLNFKRQALISGIVLVYVIHRVYLQHQADFDPADMYDFIGGNVIASSHLFGLIAGLSFAFALMIRSRLQSLKAND